jgi:hypothetical protein
MTTRTKHATHDVHVSNCIACMREAGAEASQRAQAYERLDEPTKGQFIVCNTCHEIAYCPTHAAAPALRDLLAAIVLRWDAEVRDRGEAVQFPARAYFEDARALLARIGG